MAKSKLRQSVNPGLLTLLVALLITPLFSCDNNKECNGTGACHGRGYCCWTNSKSWHDTADREALQFRCLPQCTDADLEGGGRICSPGSNDCADLHLPCKSLAGGPEYRCRE